jgi:hypothetical protein
MLLVSLHRGINNNAWHRVQVSVIPEDEEEEEEEEAEGWEEGEEEGEDNGNDESKSEYDQK